MALARALVFEPGVLLLDEPFSALDKSLRGQMQAEVKRLHEETGTTFVFVTHDQSEALALSSRVAIFNHGKLLQVGAPEEVYDRPANRFVAEFLGEINMLPLTGRAPGERRERSALRGSRDPARQPARRRRRALLAIRPEHMSIARKRRRQQNGIAATATASTYLGAATKLDLETRQRRQDHPLRAQRRRRFGAERRQCRLAHLAGRQGHPAAGRRPMRRTDELTINNSKMGN